MNGKIIRALESGQTIICPCCEQMVKMYKRKINANMAKSLIKLVRFYLIDNKPHHTKEIASVPSSVSDFAQLRRWGLIKNFKTEDPDKKSSGFWIPTEDGVLFVHNKIYVPSHCYIYNNKTYGFSDIFVSIRECLGSRFNYSELMGAK